MATESDQQRRAEEKLAGRFADELARIHAEKSSLAAREAKLLAKAYRLTVTQKARIESTSSRERDIPLRSMALELGMAVRVNDRTMQTRMHDAHELVSSYPDTAAALRAGRISREHAQVIQDAGRVLDDADVRADFERVVLRFAENESVPRTRKFATSRAAAVDPRSMDLRHEVAMRERRVWVTDLDDAMSTLTILGASVEIHGAYDRLTRQGNAIKAVDAEHRRAHAAAAEKAGEAEKSGGGADAANAGEAIPGVGTDGCDPGSAPWASAGHSKEVWFDERRLDGIRVDLRSTCC